MDCYNGQTIELPVEVSKVCDEYSKLTRQIEELTATKDIAVNKIKNLLQENEIGRTDGYIVSWKPVNSSKFDKTKFKSDNPELYDKYVSRTTYRRFSISKAVK